jgi:hypothetical protein
MARKAFRELSKAKKSKAFGQSPSKIPFWDIKNDRDKAKQEKDHGDKYDKDAKNEKDKHEDNGKRRRVAGLTGRSTLADRVVALETVLSQLLGVASGKPRSPTPKARKSRARKKK